MNKSTSVDSVRGGSGDRRSKPSSANSLNGEIKSKPSSATSGGVKSKPSSASSDHSNSSGHVERLSKPSDRLNPKTCDPFKDQKSASAFVSVYSSGGIPCRLCHGSVKHKLVWSSPVETVGFDPVLIALAEGLKETVHPYAFVAKEGFNELLKVPNAGTKALPVLHKLILPLRNALAHEEDKVFLAGLESLQTLSNAVTDSLNSHLKNFLVPISKRMFDTSLRDVVAKALQTLETNGGKDARDIIKSKIPTYSSVLTGPAFK